MGALMRAHDWAATPLGPAHTWPQSLRTSLSICLNTPGLATVLWGPDLRMLYNDDYIPSMADRHPDALGRPVAEVWGAAWDAIAPKFLTVLATGAGMSDERVPIDMVRRGRYETSWWNFSAAPIRGEDGSIVGLFNAGVEITAQVLADGRLQAQRNQLAQMFEQAPTFMALMSGPNYHFDFANPGYIKLIGNRDVVGRTVAEALPDAVQQGYLQVLDEVMRSGQAFSGTGAKYTMQAQPGGPTTECFVDFVLQPLKDADGKVTGIFVEGADVTERRLADAALRESESRFRLIADSTPVPIWVTRSDRKREFVNRAYVDFLGISYEEAVDFDWRLVLHPDDRERIMREQIEGEASMISFVLEARYRNVRGDWRWLRSESQPRMNAAGEHAGFIGAASDVTEAHEAVAILAALNDTLETRVAERTRDRNRVWNNSRDLMVTLGADGIFREVSPSWTATLGHRSEEVVNRSFLDFIHADDLSSTELALGEAVSQHDLTSFENRYMHKDGGFRWISWNTAAEGDIVYAYGRDVTAEKGQTEALRYAEELLRQSQKMEAVGQLTGGLAHDFNNLLTGISGGLEMLQTRLAQGRVNDLERYITAAQGAATRAAALTHRLLAFSRRQTLDPKPVDANRLVAGMEDLIRRTVGPEVLLEVVGAAGLWTVLVDPNQLENALLNLCINARDAMPAGGRLTIETSNKWLDEKSGPERELPPGAYLALCVSDTGTGMALEVVRRAFDPFYTTKPIGMGTGLGLSMTYGFARQSGGQARIYSEVGLGTTVCLYLPRHRGAVETMDEESTGGSAEHAQQGETVLVVDDEPTIRMLVGEVLADGGYVAMEAVDGTSALQLLRSDVRIDLLITDVGLPGNLNGRQVADAARLLRPDLKVLFITGYAENAIIGSGQLDPGMHVMTKPFGMDVLAARIKELITG